MVTKSKLVNNNLICLVDTATKDCTKLSNASHYKDNIFSIVRGNGTLFSRGLKMFLEDGIKALFKL